MTVVTFDTDPTGPWLPIGSAPGHVLFSHFYPGTLGDPASACDSSYLTDLEVAPGGRISMKADYSPDHFGAGGATSNRVTIGVANSPPTSFVYFTVNDSYTFLLGQDGTYEIGGAFATDWTAGPYWFTLDISEDTLHAEGGIWTTEPPGSGGTPDFSLTHDSATPSPSPIFAIFGGGGVARTDPDTIAEDDTWYDDWTAGSVGPPPPPVATRLLVAGSSRGGVVRNVGR